METETFYFSTPQNAYIFSVSLMLYLFLLIDFCDKNNVN